MATQGEAEMYCNFTAGRRPISQSITILALLLAVAKAAALDLVDPALEVTTFSPAPTYSVAIPGAAATNFPGFLYSTSRAENSRINELAVYDSAGVELERKLIALDVALLQAGAESYAGRMFASEIGLPADVPDGVYEVFADGTVTLFSNLGGGNPDSHGIVFGSGAFGDSMYVANPTAGAGDANANRAIARIGSDGAVLGALVTDPDGPFYLAFPGDSGAGPYGDYLYYTLLNSHLLKRVDALGNTETFATFDPVEQPIDLLFGHAGSLGEVLLVTVHHPNAPERRLAAVLPDGSIETVGTRLRGYRMDKDPDSGDLFIADEAGGILRISPTDCEGAPPQGEFLVTQATLSVPETAGTIALDVARVCGTAGEAVIGYLISTTGLDAPAIPGDHFRHPPGNTTQTDLGEVIFADGQESASILIEIIDNDLVDRDRSFAVGLQQASVGALREPTRTVVTIVDNDVGTDLSLVNLEISRISGNIGTFVGLTDGFNDLKHRFRVTATIRNNGPLPVSGFSLTILLPKLHLAGYGLEPGGTCTVLTPDPPDPDSVHIRCGGLAELASGAELTLPEAAYGLYVGYANTIPRDLAVDYFAGVGTEQASVPDSNPGNDTRWEVMEPRTHEKRGGGSASPLWIMLLAMLLLVTRRRRARSAAC